MEDILTHLQWNGEACWRESLVMCSSCHCHRILSVCSLSTVTTLAQESNIIHHIIATFKVWHHHQSPTLSESTLQHPQEAPSASPKPVHSVSLIPQEDRKLYRTYRKVTTPVVALVVDQVRQSSCPATRNREQLFREERVSERLVEEGCRRSGRCPLWLMNVSACANVGGRVRPTAEMFARRGRSSGEEPCCWPLCQY
jgi:hypothetical protein